MSLSTYFDRFRQLNVNVAHGRASPHKVCMLLAVLDLARGGALTANRVELGYDRDEGKNCTYPPQTVVLQQKILAPAAPG